MKKFKKLVAFLMLALIIFSYGETSFAKVVKDKQTSYVGGTTKNEEDNIEISKTIKESGIENYFDITLTVKTQSKIEEIIKEQSLAVVIVMDVSNTMRRSYDGTTTRYKGAKESASNFIEKFQSFSENTSVDRKIGFVTFNSNSNQVFGLTECKTEDQKKNLIDKVNAIDESVKPETEYYTNMEAGLARARKILKNETGISNKYIIFLTDGMPTTYSTTKEGYKGYYPHTSSNSNFYNHVRNVAVKGTNYSDMGARRAEELAYKIKTEDKVLIYSIGIGVSKMTDYTLYHLQYEKNPYGTELKQTVDTDTEANNKKYYGSTSPYKDRGYRYYAVLPGVKKPSKDALTNNQVKKQYNDPSIYTKWLESYIGSGSGYYFDSNDKTALDIAYNNIFENIKKLNKEISEASWVATDPMGSINEYNVIEFVGMYNDSNNKLYDSLVKGENSASNTAKFNKDNNSIEWDLKNSLYTETKENNITYYNYKIKYRVRLENEKEQFKVGEEIKTNGETYLKYLVLETVDGITKRSDEKTLKFEIPRVEGYLGELKFNKVSNYFNTPLKGTTFKLVHDINNCICKDERKHMDENFTLTSVSNEKGIVSFDKIPSGHTYKLMESLSDGFHNITNDTYKVVVSYGNTLSDAKDSTIINEYINTNLLIKKKVNGVTTNKTFNFELTGIYNNSPLKGTYKTNKDDLELTFNEEGKVNFSLKNNEELLIKDLPKGTKITIKELNKDGFIVKYIKNDSEEFKYNDESLEVFELINNLNITVVNTSTDIMPNTGSSSMLILLIIGSLFIVSPVIYIIVNVLKRKAD